ncbi:MAG: hypothetical protein K9M36_00175 [Candidatus Pacebacteria bacterium]|nr:hypothetical protein [Candidatus Paceibacterota bacterium]
MCPSLLYSTDIIGPHTASMPKIYLPHNISPEKYLKQKNKILQSAAPVSFFRSGYIEEFYPFPIIHTKKEIADLKKIQQVVLKATTIIVQNYFKDTDISDRVPLAKNVRSALKNISHLPYHIGGIRPDYLYDKNGVIKICEINARFVFNAFFMSMYANDAFAKQYSLFKKLPDFDALSKILQDTFPRREKVAIIKNREDGYDIHSFLLEIQNTELFDTKNIKKILATYSHVVLELHQDEAEKYVKQICNAMKKGVHIYNDPRTLFIVHDKRFLSILSNKKIMKRYLSEKDASFLTKHIIPTYTQKTDTEKFLVAQKNKNAWVVKKSISGKSDGLYIGKEKNKTEWKKIIKKKDSLLQPYVVQKTFEIWDPYRQKHADFYLAGVLPIWNDTVFGPGLYRITPSYKHKFAGFIQPLLL